MRGAPVPELTPRCPFLPAESSSSASTTTSTLTWISWFCALPGHEYFCEVAEVRPLVWLVRLNLAADLATPQDFIEDDFNLTGLSALVPFYKEAMEMVLDIEAGPFRAWAGLRKG